MLICIIQKNQPNSESNKYLYTIHLHDAHIHFAHTHTDEPGCDGGADLSQVQSAQAAQQNDQGERQPRAHRAPPAHVSAAREHPHGQSHHIPAGGRHPVVLHQAQRHRHVRVTVVAAQIVLPCAVHNGRARHALIPDGRRGNDAVRIGAVHADAANVDAAGIEAQVARWPAERHVVLGHVVGTGKVVDDAAGQCDAHVPDDGKEPGQHRDGRPDNAERVLVVVKVNGRQQRRRRGTVGGGHCGGGGGLVSM